MLTYITGANGFIGTHLVPKIKGEIISIPHEKIHSTDIMDFDYFYFLSSYGNLASQKDEDKIYKANVEDVLAVLRKIRKYRFKSFVYLSTSSVSLKTQTTYSRTKKAAEEILLSYMEQHDLPICIIRPFSVTGIGEQEEHLIPRLLRSCLYGEEMTFVPEPVHDYINVDDVVEGILSLSLHHARGIYQLGTGVQTANQVVKEIVESVTGRKAQIIGRGESREYDTDNWVSTNFKARSYGWLPHKTLEQSIKEMYINETGFGV